MASFWNIRRGTRPELTEGAAAVDPTPELEPIQVFTHRDHLTGFIASNGQRVTDLINAQPALRIRLPDGSWISVDRDEILLVAPPPHTGTPQRRVHRQQRRVRALLGPYQALGTAHLTPGFAVDQHLLRSRQHFLPMTNVWLTRTDAPGFDQDLDVALLNMGNVQQLDALLTLA